MLATVFGWKETYSEIKIKRTALVKKKKKLSYFIHVKTWLQPRAFLIEMFLRVSDHCSSFVKQTTEAGRWGLVRVG
jgi:hypothetical protein